MGKRRLADIADLGQFCSNDRLIFAENAVKNSMGGNRTFALNASIIAFWGEADIGYGYCDWLKYCETKENHLALLLMALRSHASVTCDSC